MSWLCMLYTTYTAIYEDTLKIVKRSTWVSIKAIVGFLMVWMVLFIPSLKSKKAYA